MTAPHQRTRTPGRTASAVGMAAAMAFAVVAPAAGQEADDPARTGRISEPFAEPTIQGRETDEYCITGMSREGDEHDGLKVECKVAATSIAVLGDGDVVYWNGLEDTEEVENSIVLEFGQDSIHTQVRRMDIGARTWRTTDPNDANTSPGGTRPNELVPGAGLASREAYNDDVLFCAALSFLAGGEVITVGGTVYYNEPNVPGTPYGVVELEGSKKTRLFDPEANTWVELGDMAWGRWYPTVVALPDGDQFVAGGVSKLIKPVYTDGRAPQDSGRNVVQTEILDRTTGEWTENPDSADKTLPLYARLHLLPNGDIYYNAAGQVFNPSGQAYDEALWNVASALDLDTMEWTDLGIPGLGVTATPGFRGSTFSIMLPLEPDEDGAYTQASFLTAGGILGTTPGTYFAVADGRIDTVDTETMELTTEATGSLNEPRWYGTGVLLPTGEVVVANGASADEVVGPGTAVPVRTPELWNPETGEWTQLATQNEDRTYHNTAVLLPDATVLLGGHDPISTLYANNRTLVPGTTTQNETRNPTFEILEPPYLFRGDRPVIDKAPASVAPGDTFEVKLDEEVDVDSVVLVRRAALTHIVDGGQRSVVLPVVEQKGRTLTLQAPPDNDVVPPGPYMLFVNGATDEGPVPSEAALVDVTAADAVASAVDAGEPGDAAVTAEVQPAAGAVAPATDAASATSTRGQDVAEQDVEAMVAEAQATTDVTAAGGVPVAGELAYHEMQELYALAGIPTPAQAAADAQQRRATGTAMGLFTVALLAHVVLRRRGGVATG